MAKQVEWTIGAQNDRREIFEFWNNRNHSKIYSRKLNHLKQENMRLIGIHSKLGRNYGSDNIRLSVVRDYLLVYQEMNDRIRFLQNLRINGHNKHSVSSCKLSSR